MKKKKSEMKLKKTICYTIFLFIPEFDLSSFFFLCLFDA